MTLELEIIHDEKNVLCKACPHCGEKSRLYFKVLPNARLEYEIAGDDDMTVEQTDEFGELHDFTCRNCDGQFLMMIEAGN